MFKFTEYVTKKVHVED